MVTLQCEVFMAFNILILTALTTLSVYNTYSVVHDYIYDNTLTNVKITKADNMLQLAKEISINYHYATGSVFPGNWMMNSSDGDIHTHLHGKRLREDTWPCIAHLESPEGRANWVFQNGTPKGGLTLKNYVDVAAINEIMFHLDDQFLTDFTRKENEDRSLDFYSNLSAEVTATIFLAGGRSLPFTPEVISQVEKFVTRQDSDGIVDEAISYAVGPNYARLLLPSVPGTQNLSVVPILDRLTVSGMEITLPLDFLRDSITSEVRIGVIPFPDSAFTPAFSDITISFGRYKVAEGLAALVDTQLDESFQNHTIIMEINLDNRGIFDATDVRSDECRLCENLTSVTQCRWKCLVQSIVDHCGCVPFTYRRFFLADPTRNNLPRCTFKKYGKCIRDVKYDQSSCAEKKSIPCLNTHNKVEVQVSRYSRVKKPYQLEVRILSEITSIVIFKDNFQNTWMQMLGQVGGNLGMFLSFSLLGAWQFFISLYNQYKEHRQAEGKFKPNHFFLAVFSPNGDNHQK